MKKNHRKYLIVAFIAAFFVYIGIPGVLATVPVQTTKKQSVQVYHSFHPGEIWNDTNGKVINAHGGGILYYQGVYYWFGEHKIAGPIGNSAQVGVHCYSSNDLYNWKDEGIALHVSNDPHSDIAKGCILERPKVIYNQKTHKFVMWFHLELKGQGYSSARAGVAISDQPEGPYTFLHSLRPNAGIWPLNFKKAWETSTIQPDSLKAWTPQWMKAAQEGLFVRRDFKSGQMFRDMTAFVDTDGKAYLIYASEENLTLQIAQLNDDYTGFSGKYIRVFRGGLNEGPAIFKENKKYYMITSGCSGWAPNAARSGVAPSIFGPWKALGNPCVGNDSALTFHSQSTYILPVHGMKNVFIFMADRWNPQNPIDGRYIWLPLNFDKNKPVIKWMNKWRLKNDSVMSLNNVKESYTLSGETLVALAEKILYKKTPQGDMYMYLLRPIKKTKKVLPAIVYFTGGGWVTGNVEGDIANAAWFRDHGIIGIAADYRVKSRHGTTPIESIQDAKSAIRYVRAHAKELGIDPNKIIAAGGSAGGHIAACTAIDGGDAPGENLKISSKPNALVLHNPVLGIGFGKAFFDAHPKFSPILQVKKGWPPTILSDGTKDSIAPFKVAERFTYLMKKAGNICVLIPVKNAGHSCDWPVSNPNFLPTLTQMTNFLREHKLMK